MNWNDFCVGDVVMLDHNELVDVYLGLNDEGHTLWFRLTNGRMIEGSPLGDDDIEKCFTIIRGGQQVWP